jgi:catechol 2,3-dioxygenase-like lactoylglutathione lyase family enzyme
MDFSIGRIDVINLFAEDFAGTRTFYQDILGLTLAFEDDTVAVFQLENTMICLNEASAGRVELAPTPLAGAEAGARVALSVFVDDVDAVCVELAVRGVVLLNGPMDKPWGVRSASFADPAGHIWRVTQDLD